MLHHTINILQYRQIDQDTSCVGYLQEHYSPIPPPRRKQRNKQEPTNIGSNNIEGKPETTRIVTNNIEGKPETTSIGSNNIDREYKSLSREKRDCQSELSSVLPDCWTSVKKKLKRSPPPESVALSTRHSVLNADKSTISNRDYHLSNFTSGPRAKYSDGSQWCRTVCVAMFRGGMKLKERLLVGVSVATVLFTLLLVVDLQMDTGMVGHRFMPTHARVKFGGGPDPPGAAYNSFRNRLLQKTHR